MYHNPSITSEFKSWLLVLVTHFSQAWREPNFGNSTPAVLLAWTLEAQPFAIIVIIVNHALVVIIWRIEVVEHGCGLNLRLATL